MAHKRVTISIDPDINDRWAKVAKQLRMTKSGLVEEILRDIIPILEKDKPKDILAHTLEVVGQGLMDVGSLFYETENEKDKKITGGK
jgi:predicted transcriptional regulator